MPRISLVLPTTGRSAELQNCLESLKNQSFRDFDVIIVDQCTDTNLQDLIDQFDGHLSIDWIRQSGTGASRARNAGLQKVAGEIVGFPDDDCWYTNDVLERVHRHMADGSHWDVVSGRGVNPDGRPLIARNENRARPFRSSAVWKLSIEFTMFFRREVCERIGLFDENLGINAGTPWGAGEGPDYLLRAIEAGARCYYDPEVRIFHPEWKNNYNPEAIAKARRYGRGMGRVLRLHRAPLWLSISYLARPLAGTMIGLLMLRPRQAKYHLAILRGRAQGLVARP